MNFSNLPLDYEIRFNGVFRHGEYDYRNKKSYIVLLRVYASIFRKNTKLSKYLEIEYAGVLRCQEHEYDHKKFPSIVLRVYMSFF